jgi:hypothetical protein
MRRSAPFVIALLPLVAACTSTSSSLTAPSPLPVNPSPVAHLTYDCSVLEAAPRDNSSSVPLLYLEPFDDGGSGESRMCALDWNGKLRTEISRGLALRQSADGSRLLAVDYPIVNDAPARYLVLDAENRVLDRLSTIWREEAVWADDNQHLCYIQDSNSSGHGGVAYLEVSQPPGLARRVATVGFITYLAPQPVSRQGGAPSAFIAGPHVLACSFRLDRALILNPEAGTVIAVRLSDGSQVSKHFYGHQFYPYGGQRMAETLVASADARYIADNVDGHSRVPVLDVLADNVITEVPALRLSAFSSDTALAVVRANDRVVEVIDWKTGRVIRRLAGGYASARPRPDSQDFLIGMPSTRHQFGVDLYIVRGDGTAFQVARSVEIIDQ